jgi:hypothetical protein
LIIHHHAKNQLLMPSIVAGWDALRRR